MQDISDAEFEALVNEAIERVPPVYKSRLKDVAFLVKNEPSVSQRQKLEIQKGQLLFGLYEGVPLPMRGGTTKVLPDKITIFKKPLLAVSVNKIDLADKIGRTIWHEVAHYFGLDHKRINELENPVRGKNYNKM